MLWFILTIVSLCLICVLIGFVRGGFKKHRKENRAMKNKCQYYDENASVCDDGDCGCYEYFIEE